jgi:Putative peptidoglycan binding domain
MRSSFGSIAVLTLSLIIAGAPARAAAVEAGLHGEIEDLIRRVETGTQGVVKWDGADKMLIGRDGDAETAEIVGAHISIAANGKPAHLTLDHISVRRTSGPNDSIAFRIALPSEATVVAANGDKTKLALHNPTATIVIDAQSGRTRDAAATFDTARIEDKRSGDWLSTGPLAVSWHIAAGPGRAWHAPVDFSLRRIAFFLTDGPAAGTIERIAYAAESEGPDLAALESVRDRLDALQRQTDIPPQDRRDELFNLLPRMYSLFSLMKGELQIDGLAVRAPTGEPLVTLIKAKLGGVLSGLSGETAAWRVHLAADGLSLSPKLLDPAKLPHHAVIDFGVEQIGTAILHRITDAVRQLEKATDPADRQQAIGELIGAAARLDPVCRIYDLALDTAAVGVQATAETHGSPLSPNGYRAAGDAVVRGFDALPNLVDHLPPAPYLPVLHELGTPATAADGTPRLKFHIASAPPKWLTVNGNDLSGWFAGARPPAEATRLLRPAAPPMTGADVRAVQRALEKVDITAPLDGVYGGSTAAAVARFQKHSGLNVDGVVDAATRAKLGLPTDPGMGAN